MAKKDETFMRECLRLAAKGKGWVSPNPLVGAVLVKGGKVVAKGYHEMFGGPHAEVNCLRNWKGSLRSATLFVNLEPCGHQGKTPPCTALIIHRGIRRVVIGMVDPNPLVRGAGIRQLRQAGIDVTVGVLEQECRELNRMFIRHITLKRPYLHIKIAQSADGRIAGPRGTRRWLTSRASRMLVHAWRGEHDAVLVGAKTVRVDDPELTVRLTPGRNPDVVILDGRFRVPERAKVFQELTSRRVFLLVAQDALGRGSSKAVRLASRGVTIVPLPARQGRMALRDVVATLYNHRIGSVLVEGGAQVFSAFVAEGLFDQLSVFVSPKHLGSGLAALSADVRRGKPARLIQMENITVQESGDDLLVQAFVSA